MPPMDGTLDHLSSITTAFVLSWKALEENASPTRSTSNTMPCQSKPSQPLIASLPQHRHSHQPSKVLRNHLPQSSRPSRIFDFCSLARHLHNQFPSIPLLLPILLLPSAPSLMRNLSTYGIPVQCAQVLIHQLAQQNHPYRITPL